MPDLKLAFLGAGRWALALTTILAKRGFELSLWEANQSNLDRLLLSRRHPDLPDAAVLPDRVLVSADLAAVTADAQILVLAVPSQSLAQVVRRLQELDPRPQTLITVTKGIEPTSLQRLSITVSRAFAALPVVVLAGPGIPYDAALGDPTSLVAASSDPIAAAHIRDAFTGDNLRVYSHHDVIGVELGAALKNVIAIAAGIADGIGLGLNAKAALLTRGLAEITRLATALGADPLTLAGLAGMGDLMVTAFSPHSRNHTLGLAVARGRPVPEALAGLAGIAEGVPTTSSALALAAQHGIDLPITQEVHNLLYTGASPRAALRRLLLRTPRPEPNS